jgi:hypothetical protein
MGRTYCWLIDAKLRASDKDLPVLLATFLHQSLKRSTPQETTILLNFRWTK